MKNYYLLIAVFALVLNSFSQESNNEMSFSLLRQNDKIGLDYSSDSFYKKLKQIQLSDKSSLSFGGSYRFQAEGFINEQFDSSIDEETDAWFLNRFMLHAHLKITDKFEFFGELNSSLITSKENIVPVDKDQLNVNQLFARYNFNNYWNILIGRQNVRLGSGRLVDIREGPNVRLSFDMAQLQYKDENTSVIAFHAVPVQLQEGVFDNQYLKNNESLSALYWTQNWSDYTNTDLYVLYKTEKNKTWNAGTADDNRTSIGLRHVGVWKGLNYNNEFVYQFGSFGNQDISAWTTSFKVEKEFSIGTVGIKTEAVSGDDSSSSSLNTFDGLYPRGAYFGRVARFGPSNLIDIHPYFDFKLGEFNVVLDYVAFWRFSNEDGAYNPPLLLEYPSINSERFIGNQIGGIVSYEFNKFMAFELESNIIFPGAFLKESGLDDTLYHFVFTTEIKF
jgi:hypothetical protein